MSDPERTSHWQFLAELLGAKPQSEPEPSPVSEEAPTESLPTAEGGESLKPQAPPPPTAPGPDRTKRSAKTPPRSATPSRHWGDVARSLGLDVPEVPEEVEEEETPVVEEAQVEPAAKPEPEVPTRSRRGEMRDERRDRDVEPARDVQPELPDFLSTEPPRDNFLEEVGLIDESFETIDESAAEIERDVEPPSPAEESPRSGSRRRRRGRHRRRREEAPEEESTSRERELEPPSSHALEPIEEGEPVGQDVREEPAAEARSSGSRRRRRRRGGERRPAESRSAESRSEEPAARESREPSGRPSGRPSRERPPEKPHVSTDDYDDSDDEGDEDFGERRSRRSIPSWSEAVQDIVNLNMAARQKSRRPRGGRGRRPNQRDR